MESKEDDTHTTPQGDQWEWVDDFKEEREKLLGDEGVPPIVTKIRLAELFRCAVHELDTHYDIDDWREGIEFLSVQNEIADIERFHAEAAAKLRRS